MPLRPFLILNSMFLNSILITAFDRPSNKNFIYHLQTSNFNQSWKLVQVCLYRSSKYAEINERRVPLETNLPNYYTL